MHEAAVGEIRGPIISVIEDIKAVRERAEKAEAEVERLKKIKPIKLSIKPYSYECGDGCCQEWGEAWLVDGEEVAFGPCEHNRMQQLLSHLGFDASIEGLDEDGEESWSL
jgi:hypothetical protein